MAESRTRRAIELVALVLVYFAAGRFGLSLAIVNESASAVWPPSGIAVSALLLLGMRAWPAIVVGAFLVNLATSGVVWSSIVIAMGNTLEAVAAAFLATRFAGGRAAFERASDIGRFVVVVLAATTIAATIGTMTLLAAGLAAPQDADSIWLTWWLGDVVGIMLVAPLVLLWRRPARDPSRTASRVEAAGLVAVLLVTSFAVFGPFTPGTRNYPLQFLVIPLLLWAAFRFGARDTALSAALVAVIAIRGTLLGLGPFARNSINESLLLLQAFIAVTTTMMLAVAAEVSRRHAIELEIRSLNEALEGHIAREYAARREAEEANHVKDRFLATLSHELRTPLNAALGWSRMLLDLPQGDERAPRATQAIYRNLLMQSRLVSDIIDVSRATVGGLALERAPVDLGAIVHAAIDTVRDTAAGGRLTFHTSGLERPVVVVGDAGRLEQVIRNLLENSVKFGGTDSVVAVTVTQEPEAARITVADNGPGIAAEFLPHVFDEFRQADESTTREHAGLGLGLSIARHIVHQHGGTISAANRSEGGAVFTVVLPIESVV